MATRKSKTYKLTYHDVQPNTILHVPPYSARFSRSGTPYAEKGCFLADVKYEIIAQPRENE